MSNYLELTQLPDGTIVLRRSDDHENPIVKIEFGKESKDFLNGEELANSSPFKKSFDSLPNSILTIGFS